MHWWFVNKNIIDFLSGFKRGKIRRKTNRRIKEKENDSPIQFIMFFFFASKIFQHFHWHNTRVSGVKNTLRSIGTTLCQSLNFCSNVFIWRFLPFWMWLCRKRQTAKLCSRTTHHSSVCVQNCIKRRTLA